MENSKVEAIAGVAHELNRAFCSLIMNDHSQPAWADAPEWQRKSAIKGVENIINNPDTTPEMSHESWLELKTSEGWVYGEKKDPEKKEHPCCVPYDELPPIQRVKDALYTSTVKILLSSEE